MAKIVVPNPESGKKKKKSKGPIRVGAIVPVTIVYLLIFAYFHFFFDHHLKWGLEYGATKANGAEVNIDSVKTSFFDASMKISNIQVTNKEAPKTNMVQIGGVSFKTLWDGLLRGKIVIGDAAIDDIMINTPRKRAGRVLPVEKSSESGMETIKGQALAETQKVLDGNIFGDIAAVAGDGDYKGKLKEMEGNLKSSAYITKMEGELKEKEKMWKERIDKLPKKDEIKALEIRIKNLKVNGKDPVAIMNSVKEIDSLYKEVDSKLKLVNDTKSSLSADLKEYSNVYSQIKTYVDQDINDLEGKMGIPSLDPKDLAMRIFGRQFGGKLQQAEKYMRLAREYMPPPKKKGVKEEFTPHEHEKGKNYRFPITVSYPKFWLKRAHINSKATSEGFSGTIAGDILNVTDDPKAIGRPAEAKLSGDFPNSDVHGVLLHAIVDHTGVVPKESGTIKVGAFPLNDVMLSNSSDVTYGFKTAIGSSELKAELEEENLKINFDATFAKIDYLVEAKKEKIKEILTRISQSLGPLTVNGHAQGTWKDMSLGLNSNIGERLQAALKEEVNKQIGELKDKLRKAIEEKIGGQKEKLLSQVSDLEKKLGVSLKNQDEAIASLKGKLDQEKKKAGNKGTDQLKEKGKDLFKKFKF